MKKTYIGNLFALILILIMIFYKYFLSLIVIKLPFSEVIITIFAVILIYAIPITLYFFTTKASIADTFSIKKISPFNILLVILISIIIQPLLMFISTFSGIIFSNNISSVFQVYSKYPLWFVIVSIAVIPAFCEELFFRGIVFSNYRNVSFFKASLMCGFIFAMAHMDGQQFFYAFFMGTIFCYLVYKTGSIFASIISHFIINCSQSILAYHLYNTSELSSIASQTQITAKTLFTAAQYAFITLPLLMLVFYIFHRYNNKYLLLETEECLDFRLLPTNDKVINTPLLINIIIFVYVLFI